MRRSLSKEQLHSGWVRLENVMASPRVVDDAKLSIPAWPNYAALQGIGAALVAHLLVRAHSTAAVAEGTRRSRARCFTVAARNGSRGACAPRRPLGDCPPAPEQLAFAAKRATSIIPIVFAATGAKRRVVARVREGSPEECMCAVLTRGRYPGRSFSLLRIVGAEGLPAGRLGALLVIAETCGILPARFS
jgi:hypothetical protein